MQVEYSQETNQNLVYRKKRVFDLAKNLMEKVKGQICMVGHSKFFECVEGRDLETNEMVCIDEILDEFKSSFVQ